MVKKLPYLPLYTGDWLKDAELSLCTPATRGVWVDLLCRMHEASRSGELRGTHEQLAQSARCSTADLVLALTDLQTTGAADVTERNGIVTVVNRRMSRAAKERKQAALRQSKKRRRGECHSGVAPPISYSISNNQPPPKKDSNKNGGGGLQWSMEGQEKVEISLKLCGYDRMPELIEECQRLGKDPDEVVRACNEWQANKTKFRGPGAIADFLRTGRWPANGVKPLGECKAQAEKRDSRKIHDELVKRLGIIVRTGRTSRLSSDDIQKQLELEIPTEIRKECGWK